MQEGRTPIPYRQINRELLVSILHSPRWFPITVIVLGLIVLGGFSAAGLLVNKGFGVTGLNRPVMWGFFITNFVFLDWHQPRRGDAVRHPAPFQG